MIIKFEGFLKQVAGTSLLSFMLSYLLTSLYMRWGEIISFPQPRIL